MFQITMLPASMGDCLWLEYGKDGENPHRVLIDGGTGGTFTTLSKRIKTLSPQQRRFELLVVTHIDIDHVRGAVKLLTQRQQLGVTFGDIWFNGYIHLQPGFDDILGPVDGEKLTREIVDQELPWNKAFGKKSVVVPDTGKLPTKTLPGGLKLTLISPTWAELRRLEPLWEPIVRAAGIQEGKAAAKREVEDDDILGDEDEDVKTLADRKFVSDSKEANASSIVMVAEYDGTSILLGADGQVPVMMTTLPRLSATERQAIAWCKMPHHGSRANISFELLAMIGSTRFLISSSGASYGHPDKEAIARVIVQGANRHLYFNYRSEQSTYWADPELIKKHKYRVHYPPDAAPGLTVDLMSD